MSELLQTRKCDKSKTCPLISNQSKLLNRDRKPLVLRPPLVQAKLAISQPGDKYEQEADRVAEQVMRMPEGDVLQRKCAKCDEDEKKDLQPKVPPGQVSATQIQDVPPIVHEVLSSPGQPLDASTRAFMEPRFGYDFSRVRVHTDARAAESARAIGARAYTVRNDIVFKDEKYNSNSSIYQRLLSHELAHVIQQSTGNGGFESDVESHAKKATEPIIRGQRITSEIIGSAPPGLYKDNGEEISRTLTIPLPTGIASQAGEEAETPELPSRISLPWLRRGRFSLGLRLGFPGSESTEVHGEPTSSLAASLQRAEILNYVLTGDIPTWFEAINKGRLARAIWGIFSRNIAPDMARSIASRLSTQAGSAGNSYELDIVILTDFSGGGLSFTIRY